MFNKNVLVQVSQSKSRRNHRCSRKYFQESRKRISWTCLIAFSMRFVYTFALESWIMEIESLHDVWHFLCHLCDPNRLTHSPNYSQLIIGSCTNKKHHHKSIALCFPANQAENLVFITILCFIKSFQAHQWTFVLTRIRPRNRRNCNKFWSLKVFWVKNVKHISAETQNWWYFVKHKRTLISLFAD